jgi:plastocyanin
MYLDRCFPASLIAAVILFLATPFIAATDEIKAVTISVATGPHSIHVTKTKSCTNPKAILVNPDDTVKWIPDSEVTKFSIDFSDSPFRSGKTHFDETDSDAGAVSDAEEEANVFKYKIKVAGGYTCDPHVIIVKGRKGKGD